MSVYAHYSVTACIDAYRCPSKLQMFGHDMIYIYIHIYVCILYRHCHECLLHIDVRMFVHTLYMYSYECTYAHMRRHTTHPGDAPWLAR